MTVFDFPNPTGPALARPPRLPIDATDRDRRLDVTRHLADIAHGLTGLAEEGLDTDHLLDLIEMTKAIAGDHGDVGVLEEAADEIRRAADHADFLRDY